MWNFCKTVWLPVVAVLLFLTAPSLSAADNLAPMPDEVEIKSTDGVRPDIGRFYGHWEGKWGGELHSRLIVEDVDNDGDVDGWYCWAKGTGFDAGCSELPDNAELNDDTITFSWQPKFSFELNDSGNLEGTRTAGGSKATVTMTKTTPN